MKMGPHESLKQMAVMAAVVTTLLFWPIGALLALACFLVLGISLESLVTLGDTFYAWAGLFVWWSIGYLPAFAYSAYMTRWGADC
jgi:hypothetical protein